jgi:hypothetical protein
LPQKYENSEIKNNNGRIHLLGTTEDRVCGTINLKRNLIWWK